MIQRPSQSITSSASSAAGARARGTGVLDESVAAGDEAILDDSQSLAIRCQGREPGIPPDTVKAHDGNI